MGACFKPLQPASHRAGGRYTEFMYGDTSWLLPQDLEAWNEWNLGSPRCIALPSTGAVNRTLLIECDAGSFALRISQRGRARVEWEHTAIRFAASNGIPVCVPAPLPSGGSIVALRDSLYGLFPTATGAQVARNDLGIPHAASAGACLARIHRAFRSFPGERARRKNLHSDVDTAIFVIPFIKAEIRTRTALSEIDQWALAQLDGRRQWLLSHRHLAAEIPARLAALPRTVLHGDFQETNLFFNGTFAVTAVIDWDQSGSAARAWDVVRALDLMFALERDRSSAFLEAYRTIEALPYEELAEAAVCYGVLSAANLWVYETIYMQNDERAKQFILPGEFTAFEERWSRVALNG